MEIKSAIKLVLSRDRDVKTFLDVGCGEGVALRAARQLGIPKVMGCDVSSRLVDELVAEGFESLVVNVDRESLPYESSSVDFVYCSEVIEHVVGTEHLLEEILRILRPGGWCFLTTPNLAFWCNRILLLLGYQPMYAHTGFKYSTGHLGIPYHLTGGHLRLFTFRALVQFVKLVGFEVFKTIGLNTYSNPRVKFLRFFFRRPSTSMRVGAFLRKPVAETTQHRA